MMFRGTKTVKDFDEQISSAGAVGNNATTWLDRTCYFESLPKERLELIFKLESDRMANLDLDEKLFKDELGAVLGEYKMDKDKPIRVANSELWDLAFTKHPYKYDTMGTNEELHSFTVEDAQYFYKTYYAPNNATLILIGDISVPKALALAEKYYGKYKSQEIPERIPPVEPEQKEARRKELTHPLANAEIVLIGYKTPAINHPDGAALEAAAAILAAGESSLLEQSLVQKGLASSVSASPYKLRYPGLFVIEVLAAPGKTANELIKAVHENIDKLIDGKIGEIQLARAKNQFLLASYNDLDIQTNIAQSIGESLVSSDNYHRCFDILQEVKTVTTKELQRVAKTYFVDSQSSTIVISPEKQK
jgi:predicted Zn-dependent peptidase